MRLPIALSPRRLALSVKGVPRWGLALGALAGVCIVALLVLVPITLYVIGALALALVAGVRVADRRYRRSRGA
jgi:hypothetical protein